jgi:biopolymer transport protein ExbD
MAFSDPDDGADRPMAEINTTPLVDVMLVLLIIFMVTAPLFTHAVKVDLPRARSTINQERPETIALSIDRDGKVFWNNAPVEDDALPERLARAATIEPPPELHLRADRESRYEKVAQVLALAHAAGIQRIGFITDPIERKP